MTNKNGNTTNEELRITASPEALVYLYVPKNQQAGVLKSLNNHVQSQQVILLDSLLETIPKEKQGWTLPESEMARGYNQALSETKAVIVEARKKLI
jgi:hypothetical protein